MTQIINTLTETSIEELRTKLLPKITSRNEAELHIKMDLYDAITKNHYEADPTCHTAWEILTNFHDNLRDTIDPPYTEGQYQDFIHDHISEEYPSEYRDYLDSQYEGDWAKY